MNAQNDGQMAGWKEEGRMDTEMYEWCVTGKEEGTANGVAT